MFTAGYLTLPEQQSIYGTGDFGQYSYLDGKGGGVYDGLWTWGPKLDQKDPTTPSGYFETVQYNSPIDPKTGKRIPTPFVSHKDNFRNFLQQGLTTSNNVASPINSRSGRSASAPSVPPSSAAGGRLPTPISSASASIWRPTTTSPGSCISMPA